MAQQKENPSTNRVLQNILNKLDTEDIETILPSSSTTTTTTTSTATTITEEKDVNLCIECEDQAAVLLCLQCNDSFCEMCFKTQHRKGNRLVHQTHPIGTGPSPSEVINSIEEHDQDDVPIGDWWEKRPGREYFVERGKYTPIRLRLKKRKDMRLLKAALRVIPYCDTKATKEMKPKQKMRQSMKQLKSICAFLSGLVVSKEYATGQNLVAGNDFQEYDEWFQNFIEIGRRHKIRNPEKMRSIYGKLIYVLQDAVRPEIAEMLEFTPVRPIKTVYTVLEKFGALDALRDPLLPLATGEILAQGKSRPEINRNIKSKERAITHIARKYSDLHDIREETLRMCILSIGDNHSYLRFNRDPCSAMIRLLKRFFSPDEIKDSRYSLAIAADKEGSRLTHDHALQYHYALQTLTLWETILTDMYRLWHLAEEDLLDPKNPYIVKNTGQGLQRVQQCPRVSKAMRQILYNAQQKVGSWVGSSVIHLGDDNVPNSLMFIDKYNQVARILMPIVNCIRQIPELYESKSVRLYIDSTFNSLDELILDILSDFFRAAFNGSGADNFFSAGSCIDGRLTSAWHWCSQLDQKRFYPVFLLTGFVGFDGKYWGE